MKNRTLSLTTDSNSQVSYLRDEREGTAYLTLDYAVPEVEAYRCKSGGWEKTLKECAQHELEAHEGLIAEAQEELVEALSCNHQHQPDTQILLRIDDIIQRLATRTCRFIGNHFVSIERGLFRDEWRVTGIRPNTLDTTVASIVLSKMRGTRADLVNRVYLAFALQAEQYERRN